VRLVLAPGLLLALINDHEQLECERGEVGVFQGERRHVRELRRMVDLIRRDGRHRRLAAVASSCDQVLRGRARREDGRNRREREIKEAA
jgi:hypothetical protein